MGFFFTKVLPLDSHILETMHPGAKLEKSNRLCRVLGDLENPVKLGNFIYLESEGICCVVKEKI